MAGLGQDVTISILGQYTGGAAFSAAEHDLDSLGSKGGIVGSAFAMVGTAALAMGATVAAGVAVGVKAAGDLQQAVANISTIKPEIDTSQVFSALNELSTRIPQTASELADSLYDIFSSVDVTAEQGLKLVETFAKGAVGASTDAKTFGTAAMGIMNAYGMSVDQATHISDVFFNTVNKGVVTGPELARGLGMVTASAKLAGVSLDELGALIVGVTKEGGEASQNINNLNNLFTKIDTAEAAKGFAALHISTVNADGSLRSVIDVMGDLKAATDKMTEAEKIAAIQKIFPDMQARAGATVIMDQLGAVRDALKENQSAAGSTEAAFAKMSATFNSQMKLLGNAWTSVLTTMGAKLLPFITPVVTAFAKWLPGAFDAAGNAITPLVTRFADAGRTIVQVFQQDWQPDESIDPIVNAIGNAAVAVRDFATDLLSTLQPSIEVIANQVMPALGAVVQTVANAFQTYLLPALGLIATELGTTLKAGLDWFATTGGPALASWITGSGVPALQQFYDWLGPKLNPAITWLFETALPAVGSAIQTAANWITTTAVPALQGFADWLGPKLEVAWSWLTGTAIPAIGIGLEGVAKWLNEMAIPALTEFAAWMQPKLQEAWTWLTGTAFPAIQSAGDAVWPTIQKIVGFFTDLNTVLAVKGVYDDLLQAWPILLDIGKQLVSDVFGPDGLAKGFGDSGSAAAGFGGAIKEITGGLPQFLTDLQNMGKQLDAIQRAATDAGLAIRGFLQSVGVPLPDNPIPGIIPSAPGSQSTDRKPAVPETGAPSFDEGVGPYGPPIPPDAPPPAAPPPAAATGASNRPPIDNSSRANFVRTAWPYMLEAAHGNRHLAEMMLGAAISENGDVGKGGDFIGNNFFGIKGEGPAGSFTADTWEQTPSGPVNIRDQFAAYHTPVEGFAGFEGFLRKNPRYAAAVKRFDETGDAEQLFQDVNAAGYATDPQWANKVSNIARNQVAPITGALPDASGAGSPVSKLPAPSTPASSGLLANGASLWHQNQQAWAQDASDANDICGPHLASLFSAAVGRPPTPDEARALAEKMGIYQVGANGRGSGILAAGQFDEYATALIQQANPGSTATVQQTGVGSAAEASSLAQDQLAGGAPLVGFNTPNHYFGATAFDAATGQFNVGGTGTSIKGGSEMMTIQQISDAGGGITSVISLLGEVPAAASAAADSLPPVSDNLAAVGTTADATTPQIAAVDDQFATTATTLPANAAMMSDGVTEQFNLMAEGSQTSVTGLGDNLITLTSDMSGNMVTTFTDMTGQVTGQTATLADGVELSMGDMAAGVTTTVTDMGGTLQTVVTDAAGNTITTVTDMSGNVISQFVNMNTQGTGAVTSLAQSSKQQFGAVSSAAESTHGPIVGVNTDLQSIKAPNVKPVLDALGSIETKAEEAERAVKQLQLTTDGIGGRKGGSGGGGGTKSGGGKAVGGSVFAGQAYMVGDGIGPEVFVPDTNGRIIPRISSIAPGSGSLYMGQGGGQSSGTTITINLHVEGSVMTEQDLVETVRAGLIDMGRRNGIDILDGGN